MDPFLAEIRIFGFNFAPAGWAHCDGQILPISQFTAVFSLLGINYGGNGSTTFALPDFRGRMPMHFGQGAGLTYRNPGDRPGTESVALQVSQMPAHTHTFIAGTGNPVVAPGGSAVPGKSAARQYVPLGIVGGTAHASTIAAAGSGLPHDNMPPYQVLNFCIAMEGIYPPRDA